MAAADEVCGEHTGAGWNVEHRPKLIKDEYALDVGRGSGLEINKPGQESPAYTPEEEWRVRSMSMGWGALFTDTTCDTFCEFSTPVSEHFTVYNRNRLCLGLDFTLRVIK